MAGESCLVVSNSLVSTAIGLITIDCNAAFLASFLFYALCFCICSVMDLRFATYNLHGFNNSKSMIVDLCENNDLVFVQEHWLLPWNSGILTNFDKNFAGFAVSGCCDIEKFAKTGGRPYGGVGVLWRQSPFFTCTILGCNDTHRCLAVKVR